MLIWSNWSNPKLRIIENIHESSKVKYECQQQNIFGAWKTMTYAVYSADGSVYQFSAIYDSEYEAEKYIGKKLNKRKGKNYDPIVNIRIIKEFLK